jgi:hypothetical protein
MAITGEQISGPATPVPASNVATTVPASGGGSASSGGRVSTLVARVQNIDARNTFQVAAGAFLVPIGILIILISWYGAAHTGYVQQQIPYLVSGSFIGLGLVILGGLLYWAHWLYRIYDQADLHHAAAAARQEELIERLIEAITLAQAGTATPPGPVRAGPPPAKRAQAKVVAGLPADAQADNGGDAAFVATASGANVHRPDCPIVARHSVGLRRLTAAEAAERPLCRICQPVP